MSTKRVTITLDNIDGLDLFFKLMRKEPKAHRYRPCYAIELYKALIRISAEQFNLVLAKLIAGLKDCTQK